MLQLGADLAKALEAPGRIFRKAFHYQVSKIIRQHRVNNLYVGDFFSVMGNHKLGYIRAGDRLPAGEHLMEHHAK